MLLLNSLFENYDGFKAIFVADNGRRKNKMLLQYAKHRLKTKQSLIDVCTYLHNPDTAFIRAIPRYHGTSKQNSMRHQLMCIVQQAKTYSLDDANGVCEDGDAKAIRYVKNDRVYKMKTGKFLRAVFAETGALQYFGDAVCNSFCEQFSEAWERKHATQDLQLFINTDFAAIYDSGRQDGNFHSCMNDEPFSECYNYIDCKAVSLRKDGTIYARAILFNAHTEDGTIVRYLDRQYSSKDILKKRLIDICIEKGLIDAYRKAGAGCSDCKEVYSALTHERLDETLYIDLSQALAESDYFPYFDTFKFLNFSTNEASNDENDSNCRLTETDGTHPRRRNYDEYNDEYTSDDTILVNVWSDRRGCYHVQTVSESYAENNLDVYDGEYYDELAYSEILGESVPRDRLDELEDAYKERHWNWDSVNQEYTPEDTLEVYVWNRYSEKYDTEYTTEDHAENNFHLYDGEYYDKTTYSELLDEYIPIDRLEELEQLNTATV